MTLKTNMFSLSLGKDPLASLLVAQCTPLVQFFNIQGITSFFNVQGSWPSIHYVRTWKWECVVEAEHVNIINDSRIIRSPCTNFPLTIAQLFIETFVSWDLLFNIDIHVSAGTAHRAAIDWSNDKFTCN